MLAALLLAIAFCLPSAGRVQLVLCLLRLAMQVPQISSVGRMLSIVYWRALLFFLALSAPTWASLRSTKT